MAPFLNSLIRQWVRALAPSKIGSYTGAEWRLRSMRYDNRVSCVFCVALFNQQFVFLFGMTKSVSLLGWASERFWLVRFTEHPTRQLLHQLGRRISFLRPRTPFPAGRFRLPCPLAQKSQTQFHARLQSGRVSIFRILFTVYNGSLNILQWEGGHSTASWRRRHGSHPKAGLEMRLHLRTVHLQTFQGRGLKFLHENVPSHQTPTSSISSLRLFIVNCS